MKINVEFPAVMKMVFTGTIEVNASMTLKEIQGKVFELFQNTIGQMYPILKSKVKDASQIELNSQGTILSENMSLFQQMQQHQHLHCTFKDPVMPIPMPLTAASIQQPASISNQNILLQPAAGPISTQRPTTKVWKILVSFTSGLIAIIIGIALALMNLRSKKSNVATL